MQKLFELIKNIFLRVDTEATKIYRLISIDDSYQDTGKVYAKVQLVGSAKTFDKPISELYQKGWLNHFSPEDVTQIAALYTAEHTQNLDLIKIFPQNNPANKASIIIVGILFSAFLILSNLTAFKLVNLLSITVPAGIVFFPLTYIFDNILTEVYGFKVSRRVIWTAMLANIIIFLGTWITIYLQPSPYWHEQSAYATVYQAIPRIFVASIMSYLLGEFINSIILAKLKILTAGHYLWLRAISSTGIGVAIDTICFTHIAFLFTVPYSQVWSLILTTYLLKLGYEIIALPITYYITHYLKRKDNIDYYDFKTNFNPFSLQV